MPLLPGKKNVKHNIHEMVKAGHPLRVAIAAALHKADEDKPISMAGYGSATNGDLPTALARHDIQTAMGPYEVNIIHKPHPDQHHHVISFKKAHSTDEPTLTNEEGPIGAYLFHHIGKIVDAHIEKHKPRTLSFTADSSEPKRVRVYDQLARLLGAKHGYDVHSADNHSVGEREYTLTKHGNHQPTSLARGGSGVPYSIKVSTGTPAVYREIKHFGHFANEHLATQPNKFVFHLRGGVESKHREIRKLADALAAKHGYVYHYEDRPEGHTYTFGKAGVFSLARAKGPAVPKAAKQYLNRFQSPESAPFFHHFESGDRVGLGILADKLEEHSLPVAHVLRNYAFGQGEHRTVEGEERKNGIHYILPRGTGTREGSEYSHEPTTPTERKAGVPILRVFGGRGGNISVSAHMPGSGKVHVITSSLTNSQAHEIGQKYLTPEKYEKVKSDIDRVFPIEPTQLARFAKLPGEHMTPKDIKELEDAHGPNPPRLPYTVKPDGTIKTKVHELHKWFDAIGRRQGRLPRGDKARHAFLVTHFGDMAKRVPKSQWYGEKTKKLEEGYAKAFPHIHPTIMKALTAMSSPGTNPHENIKAVFKILKSGIKRNPSDPLSHMTSKNVDAFEEWKNREKVPEHALKPGFDEKRLKQSSLYRGKNPGYSEMPMLVDKKTGKIVGKHKPNTPRPAGMSTIDIPSPDANGHLQPKNWTRLSSLVGHLERVKEYHKSHGSDQEKTAAWLDKEIPAGKFGPKVRNFYNNLMGRHEDVTKDVWMTRLVRRLLRTVGVRGLKGEETAPDAKEQALLDSTVTKVAKKLKTEPSTMQARLWEAEQGLYSLFGANKTGTMDFAGGVKKAIEEHGLPGRSSE